MTYLDTGCFVKLYYPEPDSAQVVARIQGKSVCYAPLHELEFVNALQLKVFLKSATPQQVTASRALVEADLKSGALISPGGDWPYIFREAVRLAEQHTSTVGLSLAGYSPLRRGKSSGSNGVYHHRHAAESAGNSDGFESCDHLKRHLGPFSTLEHCSRQAKDERPSSAHDAFHGRPHDTGKRCISNLSACLPSVPLVAFCKVPFFPAPTAC